ncbi:MAG: hypothetical protein ACRD1E_09060, partial [Terriglobales bacterium]
MSRVTATFLLLFAAAATAAAAQSAPRPQVLEVSTLFDGHGGVAHNTRVVVADGKIVRIDPKATGDLIDLRGLTVMPGWIDMHVHMTYHFGSNGKYGERACPPPGRGGRGAAPNPVPRLPYGSAPPPEPAPACETAADAELAIVHNAWATLQAG